MKCKLALLLLVYIKLSRGGIIGEKDQDMLGKNLKIMRTDFNKLIENVEDFLDDFVKQIQDAEKIVENVYNNDNDYNWQESSTEKPQINEENPVAHTTSRTVSTTINVQSAYKSQLTSENLEANEIETRRKRAAPNANNFDNKEVASASFVPNEAPIPGSTLIGNADEQLLFPNKNQLLMTAVPQRDAQVIGYEEKTASQTASKEAPVLGYQVNSNSKTGYKNTPACTSQTQEEMEMEKEQFEDLKLEVKKLSKLVNVLKDQQKIINELTHGDANLNNHLNDDENSLESSYLYKTLKDARRLQISTMNSMQNDSSKPELHLKNTSIPEVDNIKADLDQTKQNLRETKEMVRRENEKEAHLESELKRQNGEIKFLKAMMENLYDKSNVKRPKNSSNYNGFKNSDFEDIDMDSVLGVVHTPKPWPWSKISQPQIPYQRRTYASTTDGETNVSKEFPMATPRPEIRNMTSGSVTSQEPFPMATDEDFAEQLKDFFKKVHEKYQLSDSDYETELLNNETISALMQMTKSDPDRFKKFNLTDTRKRNWGQNNDQTMRKLLSMLRSNNEDNQVLSESAAANNDMLKQRNETIATARSNENSKLDDLQFKLKLIDLLTNEDQNNNIINKDTKINHSIKKLLLPQKKSDDEAALEALNIFINERQKSKAQDGLSELLKDLNEKPQTKTDDSNIERELKELQRAINNLRPKEDSFSDFDLETSPKRKDDLQLLLNQAINQNEANLNNISPQTLLNIAAVTDNPDQHSLATQQFLSQSMSHSKPEQLTRLETLIKEYGSMPYGNQGAFLQGFPSMSYAPNSNVFGSNPSAYAYANRFNPSSNLYPYINSNYVTPYNPNANTFSQPNFNPFTYDPLNTAPISNNIYDGISNSYISATTNPDAHNYNSNFNGPTSFGPYSGFKYPTSSYTQPQYPISDKYASSISRLPPYPVPLPFKKNYPNFGYQPITMHPGNNQGSSQFGVKFGQSIPLSEAYSRGLTENSMGNKDNYVNNQKTFLEPAGPYQDHRYGSNSYQGPGVGQPFVNSQSLEGNKYVMISDLTQQIQSLENIIMNLNTRGGYSQTPDEKASIMALHQRIYDLKDVIKGLNESSNRPKNYEPQQYQLKPQSFGATYQTAVPYNPSHQIYEEKAELPSYSVAKPTSHSTEGQNLYGPTFKVQNKLDQQPDNSYKSGVIQQIGYSLNNSPKPQTPQYISEATPPPPHVPYLTNSQQISYQPVGEQPTNPSYIPKEATEEDGKTNIVSRKFNPNVSDLKYTDVKRMKRQTEDGHLLFSKEFNNGNDRTIEMRPKQIERQAGYDLGDDTFTQLANVFKKYLEENMSQPREYQYPDEANEPEKHQQSRDSVLDNLQHKLNELKLQLEFQKSSSKHLHDTFTTHGMYNNGPTLTSYDTQYNDPNSIYNGINHPPIRAFVNSKKNDVFSDIVMKILEKVFESLPELSSRIFENVFTGIGNSYGDNNSELQIALKNLGHIGFIPLFFVKILESAGPIFQQLKKNQLFRQLLLPAIALGLIGGTVLFLIFFYQQQNEPYGYIGYQENSYPDKYPQYESSHYDNHYNSATNPSYNNYRQANANIPNYGSKEDIRFNNEFRNGIRIDPLNIPQHSFFGNDREDYHKNNKLQYLRGYSDYKANNNHNNR